MKRLICTALATLAIPAVAYGMVAFISLTPDFRDWPEAARFSYAMLAMPLGLLSGLMAYTDWAAA